jgi:hypothetical protein
MNLWFQKAGNFFTSWVTINFSRNTPHHTVNYVVPFPASGICCQRAEIKLSYTSINQNLYQSYNLTVGKKHLKICVAVLKYLGTAARNKNKVHDNEIKNIH